MSSGKDEVMAPVADRSVCGTMASRRERALCRPMFPRFQLAYTCARTRAVSRNVTRKRVYAPNRLPLYDPRADRGANLFGPRRRSPEGVRPCNYSTFRSEMPLAGGSEREDGGKGGRVIDKKNGVYCPGPGWRGRGDKSQGCCGNVLTGGEDHL